MVDNDQFWARVEKLQRFVLAANSASVTREEFFAEGYDEQVRYVRWLEKQAADVRREERVA